MSFGDNDSIASDIALSGDLLKVSIYDDFDLKTVFKSLDLVGSASGGIGASGSTVNFASSWDVCLVIHNGDFVGFKKDTSEINCLINDTDPPTVDSTVNVSRAAEYRGKTYVCGSKFDGSNDVFSVRELSNDFSTVAVENDISPDFGGSAYQAYSDAYATDICVREWSENNAENETWTVGYVSDGVNTRPFVEHLNSMGGAFHEFDSSWEGSQDDFIIEYDEENEWFYIGTTGRVDRFDAWWQQSDPVFTNLDYFSGSSVKPVGFLLQPNGKVVIVANDTGSTKAMVIRYNSDGSLDDTFNGESETPGYFYQDNCIFNGAVKGPSGHIYIAGVDNGANEAYIWALK